MEFKDLTSKFLSAMSPKGLYDFAKKLLGDNEDLNHEVKSLKGRIKDLEDQLKLSKGEKPTPRFDKKDRSVKESTGKKKRGPKGRKKKDYKIDETRKVTVDRSSLPEGAIHKGYRKVLIQEILFERYNICFKLERFSDPCTGKIFEAQLPSPFQGSEYGPTLRSFIISQYFASNSTHQKIQTALKGIDSHISTSQINNIILNSSKNFKQDLEKLRDEALGKQPYQHIDDTSAKVLRHSSAYTITTGNDYFTQNYTTPSKSRFWAIKALSGKRRPLYRFNDVAINYAVGTRSSLKLRLILEKSKDNRLRTEEELDDLFRQEDFVKLKPPILRDIKIGMYLDAFRAGDLGYNGSALMSDDAGQFNYIYADHALCWIHELRHYKLIEAKYENNKKIIDLFLTRARDLYRLIKGVRNRLTESIGNYIIEEFKKLFCNGSTGIRALDRQRKLTAKKMDKLLAPVWNQILPLHNNAAELDIRNRVIKRKVSMFNKSWRGAEAWDIYTSLLESCRKLSVDFYTYIKERFMHEDTPPIYSYVYST